MTTTTVAFLSRHEPAEEMLNQLALSLGEYNFVQYKGNFSNFKAVDGNIVFEDSLVGEVTLPANVVIVAVAPMHLQNSILNAIKFAGNTGKLLQPLMNKTTIEGKLDFIYCGLNQIKEIVIVTELFSGEMPLNNAMKRNI